MTGHYEAYVTHMLVASLGAHIDGGEGYGLNMYLHLMIGKWK